MAVIDDKVVAMSFESSKFESGVNKTISSLDKLKASLHFPSAGKGLDDINASAKRIDLSHIGRALDDIKGRLNAFRLAAIAVFAQVASQALRAGANFAKSFTLDPIKAGFAEYSTNLQAVQTILANTQAAGVGLKEVNATLKELNEYSDKTIYNFGQMAKNIGTFTAAGVELKTATASIKGIANLAALSGSTADQAATAMYQLSQAIAAGSVKLQDWNSVVNAGMGGTVFQRALAQTAEAMGTLKEGTVKLVGPMKNVTIGGEAFRQSLSTPGKASWLTSDVLTKTLKQFTGDLKDAELAAMGFTDAQIKSIQQTAKTAQLAATEVKTIAQVFDVAKETAASGWAASFQIVFGTFTEAKKTFTEMSGAINGFINASADARNKVLSDWKALGGRTVLIDSIKVAFKNLGLILKPIKEAFRDIFPATTGKDLYNLTLRFQEFAKALKPSKQTVEDLKRTFRGLFAIFSIAGQVIGGVVSMFGRLFGSIGDGSGGFLNFTGNIGDFLVSVDAALKKGNRLTKFFDELGDALAVPLKVLGALKDALASLFGGFSSGGFSGEMGSMSAAAEVFQNILEGIGRIAPKVLDFIRDIGTALKPAFDAYMELLGGLGTAIGEAASNMNFDAILQVIKTGLFATLVLAFKNFFGKGSAISQILTGSGFGGILGNISGTFDALRGSMVAMQQNIKADTLQKIAIAIGILAASVVALSFVDPERLKSALTAMTVAFGQLLGAMAILSNISKTVGFLKIPFIAGSLILLAGAIVVLSAAVVILAQLSWSELVKGLGGVGVLLGVISAAVIPLSANSAGMIRASIGIMGIAIALNLLALAVRQFASMGLAELGKGLGSVAASLGIIIAAMKKMPVSGMIAAGVGMSAIAIALNLLALAVRQFASMGLQKLAQGLGAIAVSLGTIVLAMKYMPKGMVKQAAALILIAGALNLIAIAIKTMGGMSIEQIAKGLGALAGALGILAGALYLMSGTLAGAAALGIAAAGIALLVPALTSLGKMSWEKIVKGLVALGAAFVVIGAAGYLMAAAVPGLVGFGAAIVLIGAGLALAGAGIFLFSTALSALIVAAPTGVGILIAAFIELQEGIIENVKLLILGLLEIVKAIADVAPQFVVALVKILDSLLNVVIQSAPKIAEAFTAILTAAVKLLADNDDKLIKAGLDLLIALLLGIKNNIGQITTIVIDIIAKFISTLASNLNKLITAGGQLLVALLKGIANNLVSIVGAVGSIITRFLGAIANNLSKIATAGLSILTRLLKAIADNLGKVIKAGTDIIVAFVTGIGSAGERIVRAARESAGKFITTLAKEIVKLADQVFTAMITLLNGLATTIDNRAPELRAAGARLGVAIIRGMVGGLGDVAQELYNKASEIANKALDILKKPWKMFSPSKVTHDIGKNIILGMVNGLDATAEDLYSSAEAVSNGTIKAFEDTFQTASPSKVMYNIGKFVGQGFANGLRGSAADIKDAVRKLNEELVDAMVDSRATIAEEQDKLAELLKEKQDKLAEINKKKFDKEKDRVNELAEVQKRYLEPIRETKEAIAENEAILAKSTATHKVLTKALKDEKAELVGLANDFDKVTEKLKEANKVLEDAIKTRDDFAKSTQARFADTPEISGDLKEEIKDQKDAIAREQTKLNDLLAAKKQDLEAIASANASVVAEQTKLDELVAGKILTADGTAVDRLATYMQSLQNQATAVKTYSATLEQLRKLGLDDKTYQKLLEEGTADQEFANQLLAGGKTAVKGLNTLDTQLETVSGTLATNAAKNLYQAGVDAAEGLVKGLQSKQAAIRKTMEAIAREMLRALRKELKIKSPSEEFAEIGRLSMEGMAKGFKDSSRLVADAAEVATQDALAAMQRSMRNISSVVTNELNPNPIITPILDLTTVRAQAQEMAKLTNIVPISAAASYGQASLISAGQTAAQMEEMAAAGIGGTHVKFEQNNYSPEALTEVEIYRQTKNQLSQLKSALAVT